MTKPVRIAKTLYHHIPSPAVSPTSRIRCRQIRATDIDELVKLLTTGLRNRTSDFWLRAFQRLSEHPTPAEYPKYGYLLEYEKTPVGALLLIISSIVENGKTGLRCSMSSWYVEPLFRSYAAMLRSQALRYKNVTYFNITPALHILPILEAQGFTRYCDGRFISVPALSSRSKGCCVKMVTPDISADADLKSFEIDLLVAHARYGCVSVTVRSAEGTNPFVFLPLRRCGAVRYAYLAYCRNLESFTRFAGPLGRFLASRGLPFVVIDASCPIKGLVGHYSGGAPKYFRGPDSPRLGDLAYSERVMFGF